MPNTTGFSLEIGPVGFDKVLIGKEGDPGGVMDITEICAGVQITAQEGEVANLYIKQKATEHGTIVGQGIVYVTRERVDAMTVLDTIDPKKLEEEVLASQGWGEVNMVEAVLAKIKELMYAAQFGPTEEVHRGADDGRGDDHSGPARG